MDRHVGAYDALVGGYLAGTLVLPLRVLLESHLEVWASERSAARPSARGRVSDPHLARLFGLTVNDAQTRGCAAVRIERARLPQALRDFLGTDAERMAWCPSPGGGRLSPTTVVEGCELTLLWLAPGERRLRHPRTTPELALVLEGLLLDDADIWHAGEIVLRPGLGAPRELVADCAGCLVLLVNDSRRPEGGPLAALLDSVFAGIRRIGASTPCSCCRSI